MYTAFLPRVKAGTREEISREFDERGPEACRAAITRDLEATNPELLDIAVRCARDVGDTDHVMTGFCMFYKLLSAEGNASLGASASGADMLHFGVLPRVSPEARAAIVRRIDAVGSAAFTRETIDDCERNNPELLIMIHAFAESGTDYLGIMQGFALLYACLVYEATRTPDRPH